MDNSLTWIVHGPTDSIAYQAHESGFDVFLGNFRGVYPRKMSAEGKMDQYWSYNLDHMARYDVAAFMKTIHSVKVQELTETIRSRTKGKISNTEIAAMIAKKLKITYVGHSLGGMVLPMYLIHQKL